MSIKLNKDRHLSYNIAKYYIYNTVGRKTYRHPKHIIAGSCKWQIVCDSI